MIRRPALAVLSVLLVALLAASCGPPLDLKQNLQVTDVSSGYFDVGVQAGKNKLVPSVSLKLRNKSSDQVRSVQVNAIFRRVGEMEMWGEHFTIGVPREGLAPGEVTKELVLQSQLGYTGEQPRLQLLQNSQFVDAKVELFLKQGSQTWSKLAEYPIQRQLLTH